MEERIIGIDPRRIVNKRGVRPVTSYHVNFLKAGFLRNGYVSSFLVTCRTPTAGEIAEFYAQEPHLYPPFEAEKRAQEELKKANAGGHVYCIDGLHRRKVVLELMEEHAYSEDFLLSGRIVRNLCPENEIALSISLNSSNEYSIRLSPCSLVLQCCRYDQIVNCNVKKKALSAAEVARRMVQCGGSDKQLGERTVKAMSETRRQVIGISRKLPVSALRYLDSLQETNPKCAEAAFTIANLKAVPKMLTDEEGGALLRRMSNFYKTQIPVPKALAPHQVGENVFYVRRAIKAIKTFMSLCEYTRLPAELDHLVSQMKHTDKHDEALADCSYEGEQIYADLAQECEKNVAGGDLKLMIARKKIVSKKLESPSDQRYGAKTISDELQHQEIDQEIGQSSDKLETPDPPTTPRSRDGEQETIVAKQKAQREFNPKRADKDAKLVPAIDRNENFQEPPGWKLMNCSIEEFQKRREEWCMVETCADCTIFDVPQTERNQDNIDKLVRHVGSTLKVTGVAHAFCSASQFSQIVEAATKIGLTAISCPMLYIWDASKIKRLTFSLQPQDIVQYAAVFYKNSTRASEKHYFSSREVYENSMTPPWTNVVSNISPSGCRLTDSRGRPFDTLERPKDLYKCILRRWCRPGGMCYNPMAKTMVAGLAAYEIGIRYIAVVEDQKCFEAAIKRIFDFASRPIKRSLSKSRFEGVAKHSAGILTFLKKAKPVTSKAGGSKRHEGTAHRDHDSRLGSEIVHSSPEAPPSPKG